MDVPEEGSDDWLWFKPDIDQDAVNWKYEERSEVEYVKHFSHNSCDVKFYAVVTPNNRIQCWACGKFLRKPKYQ